MTIKSIKTGWTGISAAAGYPQLGDFESIATVTVGSGGQAIIDFNSIPLTYNHLQLRCSFLGDTATGYDVTMQLNSDSQSNYRWHRLYGNGTSALSQGALSAVTSMYIAGDAARTLYPVAAVIDILDYTNTNKYKTVRNLTGHDQNGSGVVTLWSGLWMKTNAVSSIKIIVASNNLAQYSHFALYGIR